MTDTVVLETTQPDADDFEKPFRFEAVDASETEPVAELLEAEDTTPETVGVLGPDEFEKGRSLKTPKRRREWLAARLAAKRLLGWQLQQEGLYLKPNQIQILNREDGSPFVLLEGGREYDTVMLSISHSRGTGVAATARPGHRVGIDLEAIEPRAASFLSVMAHDEEWSDSMDHDLAEQTRLWTLKEAVSKLLGTGFTVGFHDVRFPLAGDDRKLTLHNKANETFEGLGSPTIHFDSFVHEDEVLSIAYTAGDPVHG
jgi:phosphopantetheinyl transferase